MPSVMVIFDGAGPLPQTATFKAPLDGPAVFVLSGTAWTQSAATLTEINLSLDGSVIGKPAMCFANQNANHQALRTTFIEVDNLTYDNHTIEISNGNGDTITDQNDYFQVVLLY